MELPLAHAGVDARDEPHLVEEEGGEMKVRPLCEERGVLLRVGCGRPRTLRSAGGFEVRRERIDAHAVAHTDGRQDEGEDHRAGERHAELRRDVVAAQAREREVCDDVDRANRRGHRLRHEAVKVRPPVREEHEGRRPVTEARARVGIRVRRAIPSRSGSSPSRNPLSPRRAGSRPVRGAPCSRRAAP